MKDLAALAERITDLVLKQLSGTPDAQLHQPHPTKHRQRRVDRKISYLTEPELEALFLAIEAGKSARDLAIFEVGYGRGLRASEVGLIQLAHLRLEAKRIFVTRLKGGHSGEYVLSDREVKALRAYLRKRGRDGGSLFRSRQGTITRRRLDQLMKRYGADADTPPEKRHFHCLRHSCATSLLSKHRQTIDKVKDILGHEDIRNTMIYAQITNAERTRIGEELQKTW
jgi:type 1 fimbriae regulatory protein FimB